MASRKLAHYFHAHTIVVLTAFLLKALFERANFSGRILKWAAGARSRSQWWFRSEPRFHLVVQYCPPAALKEEVLGGFPSLSQGIYLFRLKSGRKMNLLTRLKKRELEMETVAAMKSTSLVVEEVEAQKEKTKNSGLVESVVAVTKKGDRIMLMKSNKVLGPDDIPIEAWKCLGKKGVGWLTRLFSKILEGVNTKLEIWRKPLESKGFQISRTKTEYMEYKFSNSNNESRGEVKIENQELPKSEYFHYLGSIITTAGEIDTDVAHRIKAGWCKWRSASGNFFFLFVLVGFFFFFFVDLEKAYDRVPRDIIWWTLEKKGVTKGYIDLEIWKKTLESKRFRISRTKTEYMECKFSNSNNESRGEVKIENQELPKSEHFRYLGSIITTAGEIDADVAHRIKAGWCKWRSASGCWAIKKQHVDKMSVAEMRMLRLMCGKTRQDRIRNECIWEWVGVAPIEDKLRENRLRWFGHIQRRPTEVVVKRCDAVTVDGSVRGREITHLSTKKLIAKSSFLVGKSYPRPIFLVATLVAN
ncbi:hypothetical protein CsSME_00016582 [Camellia sinensis var. sinensis]